VKTNGIPCDASKLELELMPDHSVRIILRCASAYEAGLLYEDISEKAQTGVLLFEFHVTKVTNEKV